MTLRGRADDALERGDYRRAAALYAEVVSKDPSDAKARARLREAEQRWLDEELARAESSQRAGSRDEGLRATLVVLETKDALHAGTVDGAREARIRRTIEWASAEMRQSIKEETSAGRALGARARRSELTPWLNRSELASLRPELEAEIVAAGARTCARATATATDKPFALELVAAYCKEVSAPLPPWAGRPLLVGNLVVHGGLRGTPPEEHVAVERAVADAIARSVWFSPSSRNAATATVEGAVSVEFRKEPVTLKRGWTERVPYQATESYTEPIEVPYVDVETYLERVPYTAYEERSEPCAPPRIGLCTVSVPVTRYREESRTREVQKTRTEYRDRTRVVTRYREEPRLFEYAAQKHDARYASTFFVRLELGDGLRPVESRGAVEDAKTGYEHDIEFPPAGVSPERPALPSALAFREAQRTRMRDAVLRALDNGWRQMFCSEAVATLEEAARCARVRPKPAPNAIRTHVAALFGEDPERVLALPRPGEAVH